MCRKVRVMYKCYHRVTEDMIYCGSYSERSRKFNERHECPNDILAISLDFTQVCQSCENRIEWEKTHKPPTVVEEQPVHLNFMQRCLAYLRKLIMKCVPKKYHKTRVVDCSRVEGPGVPPKIKPVKPFEYYRRHVVNHIDHCHQLASLAERDETTEEGLAGMFAKMKTQGWEVVVETDAQREDEDGAVENDEDEQTEQ